MARLTHLLALLALALGLLAPPGAQPARAQAPPEIDPTFQAADPGLPLRAILTFDHQPTADEVAQVRGAGLQAHTFQNLPMIGVQGPKADVENLTGLSGLRSLYLDAPLDYHLDDSAAYIRAPQVWTELGVTGAGVTVAVLDSGVDATHPDLAPGQVTVQNVKLLPDNFFTGEPVYVEEVPNTDTSSGHGTHVAGTIAGRGGASGGRYTGIAPGGRILGVGADEGLNILFALQGFDYIIANQARYGIQVINNSWGSSGRFSQNHPSTWPARRPTIGVWSSSSRPATPAPTP